MPFGPRFVGGNILASGSRARRPRRPTEDVGDAMEWSIAERFEADTTTLGNAPEFAVPVLVKERFQRCDIGALSHEVCRLNLKDQQWPVLRQRLVPSLERLTSAPSTSSLIAATGRPPDAAMLSIVVVATRRALLSPRSLASRLSPEPASKATNQAWPSSSARALSTTVIHSNRLSCRLRSSIRAVPGCASTATTEPVEPVAWAARRANTPTLAPPSMTKSPRCTRSAKSWASKGAP